ncbi:MAG: triose-phosphate isomerase [Candidatus Paceibacterota bacterium]
MKKLIIGNWKCNPLKPSEALKIFNGIKKSAENSKFAETIICPPNIFLKDLLNLKTKIKIGAQNCSATEEGAYTGEISAKMLKEIGCQYVIIGHSERRNLNHETNQEINQKLILALKNNLRPIFCLGENKKQRIDRLTFDVIKNQFQEGIKNIPESQFKKIIIAYEPIWSIGSGNFADPKQIQEVKIFLLDLIKKKNKKTSVKIIYGGSVNSENISDYFLKAEMDGVLVGGASLNPLEFSKIINKAKN